MPESTPFALLRKASSKAIGFSLPIARTLLPAAVRARLAAWLMASEKANTAAVARAFARRSVRLADVAPILAEPYSSEGPIVLVNNALAWGGVERQVVNTLRALAARSTVESHLLCLRLGKGADYDFYKAALKNHPGEVRNVLDSATARAQLRSLAPDRQRAIENVIAWMPTDVGEEIVRLVADFAQVRPSVVHAWQDGLSISAGYAALIVGVPRIVISGRNMAPWRFAYYRPYMQHAYSELATCSKVCFLNNSEAGAHDYAAWLGLAPHQISVLRNGIDTIAMRRPPAADASAMRVKIGIPLGAPVVGSIFRFYPEKRPLHWVAAASEILARRPDCHFVVFGTGPMKAEVQRIAAAGGLSDRLHLPGTIEDAAVGLSLMDVFVLTSEFEGTPNVVLEASLIGVPVVAADAGGTREAIDEGVTGYVTDGANALAVAEKVVAILDNDTWRRELLVAGPAFVETRFGLSRMIDETLMLYGIPANCGGRLCAED